jgi:BlaI family penicillinase repressor
MKKLPRISESEWQVMRLLWAKSPVTASEVIEALSGCTIWKPKTIMTLINRLVKKGAAGFEKKGRAFHYYPLVKQEACVKAENRSFLKRVYGGTLQPMLAAFVTEADLSREEIEELKRILDRKAR